MALGSTAKSYGQILGSNDRLNFAVIGLNGRAYAHLSSLKANKSAARISHVCDVDSKTLSKFASETEREMGEAPAIDKDFRLHSPGQGDRCHHHRHARPLARTDGHRRSPGG